MGSSRPRHSTGRKARSVRARTRRTPRRKRRRPPPDHVGPRHDVEIVDRINSVIAVLVVLADALSTEENSGDAAIVILEHARAPLVTIRDALQAEVTP
jgi:hypothetical protein